MRNFFLFFFFFFSLYGFNYHLKPYQISEGVNCFFGLPSKVSNINGGNMLNSCYIETEDGYVVIDSGPTYSYAQDAYSIMEKKKKLPVKYVINTSSEEVHILGNEFYKEQGAILIAPQSYRENLKGKKPLKLREILNEEVLVNTRVIPIDRYITKDTILDVGNVKLTIKKVLNDKEHIYVYVKDKKIVFAGDMIFNNRTIPLKNRRSLVTWQKGLEVLARLDWVDIVSTHGYMTRRSALNRTDEYLKLLKSRVVKEIKKGVKREDIIRSVEFSSFSQDRLYNLWHKKNLATAYDEFETITKDEIKKSASSKVKIVKTLKETPVKKRVIVKTVKVDTTPSVKYKSFLLAMRSAIAKKRIVLIKVRSTTCKYCDQLDSVISNNTKVKKILNRYYEIVSINVDEEDVPLNINVQSTPTLIFIKPRDNKVLMKLTGIRALGELLEVLNEAVGDGHNDGYLRK